MRIEFINHSSLLVERGAVALMCDFWKDGTAFDSGWSLLCETQFSYEDFSRVTHIWFSHEHPDHFSPDSVKSIPEAIRGKITVLFQRTEDKRLISFCQKMGFKAVVELPPGEPYKLDDDFEVRCEPFGSPWGEVDSWLYIKTPEATLLNLNDCEVHDKEDAADILAKCHRWGGPIDVLAVQFSYASKQGNEADSSWIQRARDYHLNLLEFKVRSFQPKYTLPFASFVYWCHVENQYLNEGLIRVHDTLDVLQAHSEPVVMYPQDIWDIGSPHNNSAALEKYEQRYVAIENMSQQEYESTEGVSQEALVQAADRFLTKLLGRASMLQISHYLALQHSVLGRGEGLLHRLAAIPRHLLKGSLGAYVAGKIYVWDHQQAYQLTLQGLAPAAWSEDECQITISSAALNYCFVVTWGGESLQVNGRFSERDGQWEILSQFFFLARRLEQGFVLPRSPVLDFSLKKLRQ